MPAQKRFAFNVIMNWIAMAVGMAIPFFLTPFVVRHLGPTGYGIWILAVSTVSYLSLLDLGLRSAIIRFVSKADAQGNDEEARSAIQATLWFRLIVALAIAILSIILALIFPLLFKLPPDMARAAQVTVLMCSLGVSVSMVSGVFSAVLNALQRFDVLSTVSIFQIITRAGGVIVILLTGHGLTTLAYWEFAVALGSGAVFCTVALKLYPPCRVSIKRPDIATLKTIWSYSFTMFIIVVASQVIFSSDNVVVGAFLSVGLVAFYAIGGSLIVYSGQVASGLATTFTPMASGLEASGKMDELRRLLIRGTQGSLALALPVSISLLFRGKTFIGLWMGQRYSEISGNVLEILLISQFFSVADITAGNIMFAIGKHKAVAKAASVEAIFNLGLSIALVKTVGVYGVAWGTSISMAIVHLVFWPRYIRKSLGVPVFQYLWDGWGKVTLCAVPYALACAIQDRNTHPTSKTMFFAQILSILPIYVASLAFIFRDDAKSQLVKWQQSRLARTVA